MLVNGLKLPDAFVSLIDRPEPLVWWVPKGGDERWIFRGGEDGVYWVPEGTPDQHDYLDSLQLISTLDKIVEETNLLPWVFFVDDYTSEEIAELNAEDAHEPGFIPFITDFSRVIQFGYAGDGAAYCFDYRENRDEPSVIHWADAYWRRVAPSFQRFIDCFKPHNLTRARREAVQAMDTEKLHETLRAMEQHLTSNDLSQGLRADHEQWVTLYREELVARVAQIEEPG